MAGYRHKPRQRHGGAVPQHQWQGIYVGQYRSSRRSDLPRGSTSARRQSGWHRTQQYRGPEFCRRRRLCTWGQDDGTFQVAQLATYAAPSDINVVNLDQDGIDDVLVSYTCDPTPISDGTSKGQSYQPCQGLDVFYGQGCPQTGGCEGGVPYVDTLQNLSSGDHDLVFMLWDANGNVYQAEKIITVE